MTEYAQPSHGKSVAQFVTLCMVNKPLPPKTRTAIVLLAATAAMLATILAMVPSAAVASGKAQISQGPCVVWLGLQSRPMIADPVRTTFEQCAMEIARIGYDADDGTATGTWSEIALVVTIHGEVYYQYPSSNRLEYWGTITVSQDEDGDGVLAPADQSAAVASGKEQISQGPCVVVVWLDPQRVTNPVTTTFEQCAMEVARSGYYHAYQDDIAAGGSWSGIYLMVTMRGEVYYQYPSSNRLEYWGTITVSQDENGDGVLAPADQCPTEPETFNGFNDADGCPDSLQDIVQLLTTDIDDFWRNAFADAEISYTPPRRLVAYTRRTASRTRSRCGTMIPDNAFYCRLDHTIYYDADLFNRLLQEYGDYAIAVVIAHEWAHSVQAQLVDPTAFRLTIDKELEADCLAGAYTAYIVTKSEILHMEPGDVEEGFYAIFSFGDNLPWFDPQAHGTSLQRVEAFVRGVSVSGVSVCLSP